jgi:hypothetical protein
VDRRVDDRAVGQVNERAVLHERGVQRGKAPAREIGELAEIALHDVGVVLHGRRERSRLHALRQPLRARQRRVEAPVHDHETDGRVGVGEAVQPLGGARDRAGRRELDRVQRGDVGEPPLFVAHRRDPERGEARRATRAQIFQPPRPALGTFLECLRKYRRLFCYLCHLRVFACLSTRVQEIRSSRENYSKSSWSSDLLVSC